MRVAVIFLYLLFLLFKGDAHHHAVTYGNTTSGSHTGCTHKSRHPKFVNLNPPAGIEDVSYGAEEELLIGDDTEDEEAGWYFTGQYRWLARYCWTISFGSVLNYLHRRFPSPLCFEEPVSDLCIMQRVLRI